MIDSFDAQTALRNRALTLTVCTTGAVSLSAAATGFARTTGSFVTDGFKIGMEIVSSGFSTSVNNGVGVISYVAPDGKSIAVSMFVLTYPSGVQTVTRPATVVEAESAGRAIAARLYSMRAWENVAFTPVPTIPYAEEDFGPGGGGLIGFPADGSSLLEDGVWFLRLCGLDGSVLPNVGSSALRKTGDALKRLFTPGTKLFLPGGGALLIRGMPGEPAVSAGQIITRGDGRAICPVAVPWKAFSQNLVAV